MTGRQRMLTPPRHLVPPDVRGYTSYLFSKRFSAFILGLVFYANVKRLQRDVSRLLRLNGPIRYDRTYLTEMAMATFNIPACLWYDHCYAVID